MLYVVMSLLAALFLGAWLAVRRLPSPERYVVAALGTLTFVVAFLAEAARP